MSDCLLGLLTSITLWEFLPRRLSVSWFQFALISKSWNWFLTGLRSLTSQAGSYWARQWTGTMLDADQTKTRSGQSSDNAALMSWSDKHSAIWETDVTLPAPAHNETLSYARLLFPYSSPAPH